MRSNCSPMPCSVSQCVGHTATRTAPAFKNASICSRVVSGGWPNTELLTDAGSRPCSMTKASKRFRLSSTWRGVMRSGRPPSPDPTTGEPVGLSFLMPQSVADLERRRTMMAHWAWASCGMMGRSPDFLNVLFTAWAGAADYFAQNRPEFKRHIIQYYEFLREQDVALTHALVNLQRRRTPAAVDTLSEDVALTVVRETDAGIIVRGSRLLA